LEEALALKPDKKQYRRKLDNIRGIRARCSLKFSMKGKLLALVSFPEEGKGVVLEGKVEQGTIRTGDVVRITERHLGTVYEVTCPTGKEFAVVGQEVTLAIVTDWEGPDKLDRLDDMFRGPSDSGKIWQIEGGQFGRGLSYLNQGVV